MTLNNLGYRLSQSQELARGRRHTEAIQLHEQALGIYRRLAEGHPEDLRTQWYISNALSNLAQRHKALAHFDVARSLWEECLQIRQDLVRRRPNSLEFEAGMAVSHIRLGWVISLMPLPPAQGFEVARKHYEQARALLERLVRENPAVFEYRDRLCETLVRVSELYEQQGDGQQAQQWRKRAMAACETHLTLDPAYPELHVRLARLWGAQAKADVESDRFKDALDLRSAFLGFFSASSMSPLASERASSTRPSSRAARHRGGPKKTNSE